MSKISNKARPVIISCNSCWYAYNFGLPLIRAILASDHRVVVLAPRDEYTDRMVATGAEFRHLKLEAKGRNPLRELATVRAYRKAYRELNPAIVLHYTIKPNIYGSVAARRLGIPVINNVTGLGTLFNGGLAEKLGRLLYRWAFNSVELVFFQNPDDRELFISGELMCPDHCDLLPGSGVDLDRFAPQPRPEGPFTFLYIGRLLKAKGVQDFIDAARLLRLRRGLKIPLRFVMVGEHDPADIYMVDSAILEAAIAEGVVEYPGTTSDVRPFLTAADCVVLVSYREGVPRSLLEAAAMGRPLIAANSVGTREPVEEGRNGFLCRPKDPADLCRAMEAMLDMSADEREQMGAESRRIALERFDKHIVIDKYQAAMALLADFG
jgi:glycosyltransferase involved in cell wall biosynthesis